jgi:hypothetical protein
MDALPLELLIKITSYDWMAWANLALACPRFCKWAADPVQIARFMRTFIKINEYTHGTLSPDTDEHSWFDYPVISKNTYREWNHRGKLCRKNGLPYEIGEAYREWSGAPIIKIHSVYDRVDHADKCSYDIDSFRCKHIIINTDGTRHIKIDGVHDLYIGVADI